MISKEKIIELMLETGPNLSQQDINYDKTFAQLGLDSLDVFSLFAEVENETGVNIPDEDFEKIRTLNELYDYLSKKTN